MELIDFQWTSWDAFFQTKLWHWLLLALHIQEFPIDIVKIDKSLVDNIDIEETKRMTLEALAELLKKLNIKTIVEGIETIEQSKLLSAIDLCVHQGFVYSRPLKPADIANFYDSLKAKRPWRFTLD